MKRILYSLLLTWLLLVALPSAMAQEEGSRTKITTSSITVSPDTEALAPAFIGVVEQKGRNLFRLKFKGEPLGTLFLRKNNGEVTSAQFDEAGEVVVDMRVDRGEEALYSMISTDYYENISTEVPFTIGASSQEIQVKQGEIIQAYPATADPLEPWLWAHLMVGIAVIAATLKQAAQ